jgi:hypothetical protein
MSEIGLHNRRLIGDDAKRNCLRIRRLAKVRLVENEGTGLKNIPVTDHDSRPVGVVNARDALQVLLKKVENEESLLRDYVMCVGYH